MDYIFSNLMTMNRDTIVLAGLLELSCIILSIIRGIITRKCNRNPEDEKNRVWVLIYRILSFIPLILCLVHLKGSYLKGLFLYTLKLYLPLYIGSVVMALFAFFGMGKIKSRVIRILTVLITVAGVFVSITTISISECAVIIGNGTQENYVDSFDHLLSEMEAHYAMNEWKEIDYQKIREELMPKVIKAQENNDLEAYYMVLCEYINNFHDQHIWINTNSEEASTALANVYDKMDGNDFGFSLFKLDSGETIAILVDEGSEAENCGITNGTVITKWNGVDIDEAMESGNYLMYENEPVKANFEIKRPIYFAGQSGDYVDITFLDGKGEEKTAHIEKTGSYSARMDYALECLSHKYHFPQLSEFMGYSEEKQAEVLAELKKHNENFKSEMITEDCGYLAITSEGLDDYKDSWAQIIDDYPEVVNLVDQKLEQMSASGMKKLIIDARNNGGGYPIILKAVVSLFTEKPIDLGYECYVPYTGGEKKTIRHWVIPGNGKWKDLEIVVIANSECASSGDGLVYALSECPNVTVTGITNTSGIFQSIGGVYYLTDSHFSISYPVYPNYNEDGTIVIDTKPDGISRVPLDVKIPMTKKAALEIFTKEERDGLDYEIRYALELFGK